MATTMEPVRGDGVYEMTDGSFAYFHWEDGRLLGPDHVAATRQAVNEAREQEQRDAIEVDSL